MGSRSFAAFLKKSRANASRLDWCGEKNCTWIRPKCRPMPLSILSKRVLPLKLISRVSSLKKEKPSSSPQPLTKWEMERFPMTWPIAKQVTGDTVYGTVENIAALEQEHIRAYIPLADYESRTSLYGKQAFRYDPMQDVYICPNNQRLPLSKIAYTEREKRYRADPAICDA